MHFQELSSRIMVLFFIRAANGEAAETTAGDETKPQVKVSNKIEDSNSPFRFPIPYAILHLKDLHFW